MGVDTFTPLKNLEYANFKDCKCINNKTSNAADNTFREEVLDKCVPKHEIEIKMLTGKVKKLENEVRDMNWALLTLLFIAFVGLLVFTFIIFYNYFNFMFLG